MQIILCFFLFWFNFSNHSLLLSNIKPNLVSVKISKQMIENDSILREKLKDRLLTQAGMAKKMKIDPSTLSQFLKGKKAGPLLKYKINDFLGTKEVEE